MKKVLFAIGCISLSMMAFAQKATRFNIISEKPNQIVCEIYLGDLEKKVISTNQGDYLALSFLESAIMQQKGFPALPAYSKSFMIPNTSNSEVKILESDYVEYHDMQIIPSKGHITRKTNFESVPYEFGEVYEKNAFFPGNIISLNEPYIFRDYRGQAMQFFPVQYNPKQSIVKVYNYLKIEINFSGISNINVLDKTTKSTQITDEFDGLYANRFVNYASKPTRYSPIKEVGSMLVVCPSIYQNAIQPFVEWKERKGIKTYVSITDTMTGGLTEANLLALSKWYYEEKNIAYMLLVGDNTNIPARNESGSNTALFGPSDMGYAYVTGNDHYPEFIVGRFSGNTVLDIESQVKRTLDYERNPNVTGNWMGTQIGIASAESGLGADDGQADFEHILDIVDSNKNQYNYVNNIDLFDGFVANGGTDAAGYPTTSMLLDHINNGASLMNYAGHGASDGITTCAFTTPEVANINNTNKLPFFFVVGCQPGNFINQTSFSEEIMRHGGANPKGLISCYMSNVDQWWAEPMEAQDEFNAVMRGARPNNLRNKLGAICVSGAMAMNDKYSNAANDYGGDQMTDTWVFFGDPSVSLYNKNEGVLNVVNTINLEQGQTSLQVNCNVNGATIGLYYQGKYLASGITSGGGANLTFPPISGSDTIFITATKQNHVPAFSQAYVQNWALGTSSTSLENGIDLYPNPAKEMLQGSSKSDAVFDMIEINDITGKKILSQNITGKNFSININSLSAGVYFAKMSTSKGVYITKFTKN